MEGMRNTLISHKDYFCIKHLENNSNVLLRGMIIAKEDGVGQNVTEE